jgi:phosphopantothenoylcysteine synthetase/decarboxylase
MIKVTLGLTGSIAAILCSKIIESINEVSEINDIILTNSCKKIFGYTETELPYNTLFLTDDSEWSYRENSVLHIDIVKRTDIIVIAPATANTIAKIANGISDNLLTNVVLAFNNYSNIIVCPAMNTNMWSNPITQQNINKLKLLGVIVIEPQTKELYCGDFGSGAMCEINEIAKEINRFKTNVA